MILTDEILKMIKEEGPKYFDKKQLDKTNVWDYLDTLMEKQGVSKNELVFKMNLDESYGRRIFGKCKERRMPTRKILLQCAFLMSLDLIETQRLLEIGQKPRLYGRIRYDAAIIYGIERKMNLEEMNSFLEKIGEKPLV